MATATALQTKKQLKEQIKSIRSEMESKEIVAPYINLQIASEQKMNEWIEVANQKLKEWQPTQVLQDEQKEVLTVEIGNPETLSELGEAIARLSGSKGFEDWEFKSWTKNGTLRIYAKDISFTNPKERGYYLIKEDGTYESFVAPNNPLPKLPLLPPVKNDLVKSSLDPYQRAIQNLNRRYGEDQWSQLDLDDELECEEYQ